MTELRVIAIKSDGDAWELDVLGVPWGGPNNGRDSDGEYFDANTKLYLDRYATVPAVYYHGYDENGHPHGEPQFIGKTTGYTVKDNGVWFRVVLDKANDYARRVWDAAKNGIARASSGSISHLRRVAPDGHITHWPVAELSIFDAVGKRQPANQYAVALPVAKAVYAAAGLPLPDDIEGEDDGQPEAGATGAQQSAPAVKADDTSRGNTTNSNDPKEGIMDEQNVQQMIAAALEADRKQRDAEAAAKAAEQAKIDAAVAAKAQEMQAQIDAAKAEAAAAQRLPGAMNGAPTVAEFGDIAKFDNLEIADLATLAALGKATKMAGKTEGPSLELLKALTVRLGESDEGKAPEYGAAKAALKAVQGRVHGGKAVKANELNYSTYSSYGDEWIGVTYSNALWDKIRLATPVVGRIPTVTVPQGSESVVIPLLGTSPTFYKVAQATAQDANPGRVSVTYTSSKLATGQQTLTVSKLGAMVNWGSELDEDSFVPWVQELRRDLTNEAAEILEHLVIDGDTVTTATTNINCIGGTPAATAVYLVMNGFRKLALVTNTANSRSAGTLTVEDYLETLKLMGLGGRNAADRQAVSFITDMHTNWASLSLAELKTTDVNSQATVENGQLTRIWGREVVVSPNMHRANQDATYGLKANTAGKVDLDTASNNVTGSILAVRWDQWRFGYKRMMNFEIQREPQADATTIVVNMRVGLINRDNEASAISYGVTLA
jgi:HK97 family phage major capsid protein